MPTFPIKTCVMCGEEFELRPGKPGYANRCLECSTAEVEAPGSALPVGLDERRSNAEANEARRAAIRNLLYRKED